jgi:hypothetical protein
MSCLIVIDEIRDIPLTSLGAVVDGTKMGTASRSAMLIREGREWISLPLDMQRHSGEGRDLVSREAAREVA